MICNRQKFNRHDQIILIWLVEKLTTCAVHYQKKTLHGATIFILGRLWCLISTYHYIAYFQKFRAKSYTVWDALRKQKYTHQWLWTLQVSLEPEHHSRISLYRRHLLFSPTRRVDLAAMFHKKDFLIKSISIKWSKSCKLYSLLNQSSKI